MKCRIIYVVLIILGIVVNSFSEERLLIVYMSYETFVNDKYGYLTGITYDYLDYPNSVTITTTTKSLKGVPPKYQISSTTTSKLYLDPSPKLYSQKVVFSQGNFESVEQVMLDQHKGTLIKASYSTPLKTFSTNFKTNFIDCFDIPSLLLFISDKKISDFPGFTLLVNSIFTNIYLTNITQVDEFGNIGKDFVRFKKVSDLNVVDRFRISDVIVGVFTNVSVEGRLVDIKIVRESDIKQIQTNKN